MVGTTYHQWVVLGTYLVHQVSVFAQLGVRELGSCRVGVDALHIRLRMSLHMNVSYYRTLMHHMVRGTRHLMHQFVTR